MITLEKVTKSYGAFQVLKGCSAKISKGEVVVVCGPSGSGKSTLIKCINALETFESGQIYVDGMAVRSAQTNHSALRAKAGMVFQSFELFSHLTILENIMLAPRIVQKRNSAEIRPLAEALLRRVGLERHASKYPIALSGGQQQRAAIARALAMKPDVMLFDEPTSALDPEMVQEVLQVMTELARDGMTMMCVTHEMGFARQVATRILFVDAGEIVDDCPAEDFFAGKCSPRAQSFLRFEEVS
ncbi:MULTISPECIES: amino acid ABC transporter ATP-binding protein [unclassified Gluconobacter]|uniref:amino acid ABC transporter ATP-binding protein n=1 Tax=unclassified Gluconobacter TaxID=2644261 RepID=UPI001756DB72|nr:MULTISPECIES: amino acid ABC transporter ATP-binding protein [unclassified Gluconobacter]GFE97215.1 arginine ABC transporter ATP-binding protein [Gluconobacter sp. Gdi]